MWLWTRVGRLLTPARVATFPCPLAHQLDLCPSIGYAAALDRPRGNSTVTSLPDALESALADSLNAFSTSLLSMACGRDLYSPVSSCDDCFTAYRDWLCRVLVPQCTEGGGVGDDAIAPRTVDRAVGDARTNLTASPSYAYTELLPCLATCRRVARTCPPILNMACPVRGVNANESYAYWGRNGDNDGRGEGEEDGGIDVWGNRWCSGSSRGLLGHL